MPPKPRSYDPKCHLLAEQFLSDHLPFSEAENDDLAQTIQDAIEDWFFARENHLEGHE
jgi:Mn-dependent DtxR family transcriptional regulator